MNTNQGIQISQNQQMILSPKMVEELKILQMSYVDLMQYIDVQLIENPLLEIEADDLFDSELPDAQTSEEDIDDNDYEKQIQKKDFTEYTSRSITLREHLLLQIGERQISSDIKKIVLYLIETVNDDGYLCTSISDASCILGVPVQEVKKALKVVQKLEPAGIGARNLKECILIQLSEKKQMDDTIAAVVKDYLELLAEKKYKTISEKLGLPIKQIVDIHQKIKCTDPKPGLRFAGEQKTGYIQPELVVKMLDNKFIVLFSNESTFNLRVNEYYKKLTKSEESSAATKKYIKSKVSKAMELINTIEQRKSTILKVASCIIEYQEEFLRKGHMFLRPLTLKAVADNIGLHESTISRTVNEKYIETPRGVFELKFFFSSQLDTADDIGIAANAIKKAIKDIILNEEKKKPLSDEQISGMLEKNSIRVARRTVAKYREELHILPANLRRF